MNRSLDVVNNRTASTAEQPLNARYTICDEEIFKMSESIIVKEKSFPSSFEWQQWHVSKLHHSFDHVYLRTRLAGQSQINDLTSRLFAEGCNEERRSFSMSSRKIASCDRHS